jgi:hypothetical protein
MFTERINGAKCNSAVSAERQRENNFAELLPITRIKQNRRYTLGPKQVLLGVWKGKGCPINFMFDSFIVSGTTVGRNQALYLIPTLFSNYFQLSTLYGIKG